MTQFLGHNYIGGQRSANGDVKLHSVDATTGEALPQDFYQATAQEVDAAARAAAQAYPAYSALSAARRARRSSSDTIGATKSPVITEDAGLSGVKDASNRSPCDTL